MLLLLLRGPRPVFSVVLRQASVSRELRNTTNLSVVLVIYSACLDLSLLQSTSIRKELLTLRV